MNALHVEVCLHDSATESYDKVRETVLSWLQGHETMFLEGSFDFENQSPSSIRQQIESIKLVDFDKKLAIPPWEAEFIIHIFKMNSEGAFDETLNDDDQGLPAFKHLLLPASEYKGIWESLIFDGQLKHSLLAYANTAMLFSEKKVDCQLISWNRVIFLHGPPGTGKTSLCKGIAQKLSIRFSEKYPHAYLLEINAHSLFSKWFSESGKLVTSLFQHILELVEDTDTFVSVLIDEIESLTAARKAAISGAEPSDSIRVVNALLTQLDQLKSKSNVLILATSNISEAVDVAFLDRADVKQYVGLPSLEARYEVLRSCILELNRVGIISPPLETILHFPEAQQKTNLPKAQDSQLENQLLLAAAEAADLSGRALRKLPLQTHAFFIQTPVTDGLAFCEALRVAIAREHDGRSQMAKISEV